jgi:YbgC/YbaW family acyl-CoA thioester hydrolase
MPFEFKLTHLVEFADTDMAGIVHFANFFRFMEETEHAFLRSVGLSVHMKEDGRIYSFPRVHAECSYKLPLRFEDEVEVHLLVREKKSKSLAYEFIFRKVDGEGRSEVARGALTVVCVTVDPKTREMKAAAIPAVVADKIQAAPDGSIVK